MVRKIKTKWQTLKMTVVDYFGPPKHDGDATKERNYIFSCVAAKNKQTVELATAPGCVVRTLEGDKREGSEITLAALGDNERLLLELIQKGVVLQVTASQLSRNLQCADSPLIIRQGCALTTANGVLDEGTRMTKIDIVLPAQESFQFTDQSGRIRTHPGRPEETDEQLQARVAHLIERGYIVDESSTKPLPPHPKLEHQGRGY